MITISEKEYIELKRKANEYDRIRKNIEKEKAELDEFIKNKNNIKSKHAFGHKNKFVYVIGDQHYNIKIGISNNPGKRKQQLQTSNSDKLYLRSFIQGDEELEKALHNKLYKYKTKGEWFKLNDDVREILYSVGLK